MRSVPRISSDMNRVKKTEPEFTPFFEEHESKTVFFATRRDFLNTIFIEDPQLVLKRQKELEEEQLNNAKEEQVQNPTPTPSTSSTQEQSPSPSTSFPPSTSFTPSATTISPPHHQINKNQKNIKNQKEPPKEKPRPIIKLTRNEINNVIDRLVSSNDNTSPLENRRNNRNKNIDTEKSPIRKKYIDSDTDAVFERLYCESTQRKTEKRENLDDHEDHDFHVRESDEEILTKSLALQKIKEMIDASFPDKQGLTLNELKDIFIRLGIVDNCEKMEKISQISYIIDKWKILNTDLYDSIIIKNTLTQSIIGRKGKFRSFARERMFSYLANRKNNENCKSNQQPLYSNQSETQINHSKKLTQETFDRLLSPRPDFSPPKNEEEEDINYIPLELSPRTQKILKDSEYGNVKLEERDRILTERAMAKIESIRKQMEKERLKMQKKKHSKVPKISPEERAKIDELKLKRQKEIENAIPPYKPEIMKFSDFLHLKETMIEEKEKPPGFDAFLDRIKKGYEQNQKKKFEEETIRSLPQLPSKKRAASSMSKKKKEKPPSDQQETPEPIEPVEPIPDPIIKIEKKEKEKTPTNTNIKSQKTVNKSNSKNQQQQKQQQQQPKQQQQQQKQQQQPKHQQQQQKQQQPKQQQKQQQQPKQQQQQRIEHKKTTSSTKPK